MTTYKQTPSQTVGPYFAYGLCPEQYNFDLKSLFTPSIADRESRGAAHQHRGASVRR